MVVCDVAGGVVVLAVPAGVAIGPVGRGFARMPAMNSFNPVSVLLLRNL